MFDAVTYGAAVGAAKRYTDEHSGSDDAVKYTEQSLTSAQQAQARENIGAAAIDDIPTDAVKYTAQSLTAEQQAQVRANIGTTAAAVKYTEQTLTSAQQAQARENIGAAAVSDIPSVIDYSTTEQDTGIKWVDGKSVYQKTYVFDPPAGGSNAYIDLADVSGLSIDTLIYMSGIEHDTAYGNFATIETHTSNMENLFLTADKSTVKYISPLAIDFLTLRYTKTANGNE